MSPALNSEPAPDAATVCRNMVFEEIVETAAIAESYARSLGEAAWRADKLTVETHIRQLRACVVNMIGCFKDIEKGCGE